MTRGRHANHVHVTGTTGDPEHAEHRPVTGAVVTLVDAVKTLQAAAVRIGAEQSAHALLDLTDSPRRQWTDGPKPPPVTNPAAQRRQAELMHPAPSWPGYHAPPKPQSTRSLSR